MNTVKFGLDLETNTPLTPLSIRISIADDIYYDGKVDKSQKSILCEVPDNLEDTTEYDLDIEIYGKTDSHTKIINDEIIDTTYINIVNLYIDDLLFVHKDGESDGMYNENVVSYTHNNNGYSNKDITEPFTRYIGANGIIKLKLYTPIYLWMLEYRYGTRSLSDFRCF